MGEASQTATYLLTWSPKRWTWTDLDACIREVEETGHCVRRWSSGNRRQLPVGSRVFLFRQGVDPCGIVASGHVEKAPYEATHWSTEEGTAGKRSLFVDVRFDYVSATPLISRKELGAPEFGGGILGRSQSSGTIVKSAVASELEQLWSERTGLPPTGPKGVGQPWELRVGDTIKRTQLHAKYGGRRQGGISPSRQSPNVMVFTDPETGTKYGYTDGWTQGVFHYTGEGQEGDQTLDQGNGAILHHHEQGRALRLFDGASGVVEYAGEFELDPNDPYYRADATELRSDRIRQVIVFRFIPIGAEVPAATTPVKRERKSVPLEEQQTERALVAPNRQLYVAERRENTLVCDYEKYIASVGEALKRERLPIDDEASEIINDIFNPSRNQLIEAKGTVTREAIRMAIGQLADYARFYDAPALAVLLPERPRKDLEELLRSQDISVIWRAPNGEFEDNAEGLFLASTSVSRSG